MRVGKRNYIVSVKFKSVGSARGRGDGGARVEATARTEVGTKVVKATVTAATRHLAREAALEALRVAILEAGG
jgi:hypothetical protein